MSEKYPQLKLRKRNKVEQCIASDEQIEHYYNHCLKGTGHIHCLNENSEGDNVLWYSEDDYWDDDGCVYCIFSKYSNNLKTTAERVEAVVKSGAGDING